VGFFDFIQSVDRLDLAQDIDRHAQVLGKKQNCLIEVKISPEPTKSGLDPKGLGEFLTQLQGLQNLEVRGLMGIPPLSATGKEARPFFRQLKKLFDQACNPQRATGHGSRATFNILSMGMSSDFEIAIEEGSTMVRLGAALFGSRPKS